MRRFEKYLAGTILTFFILLIIAIALIFTFKNSFVRLYFRNLTKPMTVTVRFSKAQLTLFSTFPYIDVHISDMTILSKDSTKYLNDTLFYVPKAEFLLSFFDLIKAKNAFPIVQINYYKPRMYMFVKPDGQANFILYPADYYNNGQVYTVKIQKLNFVDATVVYLDFQSHVIVYLTKASGHFSSMVMTDSSAVFYLSMYSDRFGLKVGKHWYLKNVHISLESNYLNVFSQTKDNYFFEGNFSINNLYFAASGKLLNWELERKQPYYFYKIDLQSLNSSFGDLVAALPGFYQRHVKNFTSGGKYDVYLHYLSYFSNKLRPRKKSHLKLEVELRNGWLHYQGMSDTLKDVNLIMDYAINNKRSGLKIRFANFVYKSSFFSLLNFYLLQERQGKLRIRGRLNSFINLHEFSEVMLPHSYNIYGKLQANIAANGQIYSNDFKNLNNLDFDGRLVLKNFLLKTKDWDFCTESAVISAKPAQVRAKIKGLRFLDNRFDIDLTLKNWTSLLYAKIRHLSQPYIGLRLNGSVWSDSLDLDTVQKWIAAKAQGGFVYDTIHFVKPFVPKGIRVKLHFYANDIRYKYFDLQDFLAYFKILPNGQIEVNPLYFKWLNAEVNTSFTFVPNGMYYLSTFFVDVKNLGLKQLVTSDFLKKVSPILQTANGKIDIGLGGHFKYNILSQRIDMNSFFMRGVLKSDSITLQKNKIFGQIAKFLHIPELNKPVVKDLNLPFTVANRNFSLIPTELNISGWTAKVKGYTSFDGLINYQLGILVPPKKVFTSVHKLVSGNKSVYLYFTIYGSAASPKIKIGSNLIKRDVTVVNQTILSLQQYQDSIEADAQVRASRIIINARHKSQQIMEQARQRVQKIMAKAEWLAYLFREQAKSKQLSFRERKLKRRQARRILRNARKLKKYIMQKAREESKQVMKIARQQSDEILKETNRKIRKIQKQILHEQKRILTDSLHLKPVKEHKPLKVLKKMRLFSPKKS